MKRAFALALLVACAGPKAAVVMTAAPKKDATCTLPVVPPPSDDEDLELAQRLLRDGQFTDAFKAADAAVKAHPTAEARATLALVLDGLGDVDGARAQRMCASSAGATPQILLLPTFGMRDKALVRAGRVLDILDPRGLIWSIDVHTHKTTGMYHGTTDWVSMAATEDGRAIYAGRNDGGVDVVDTASGSVRALVPKPEVGGWAAPIALSSDEKTLGIVRDQSTYFAVDAHSGSVGKSIPMPHAAKLRLVGADAVWVDDSHAIHRNAKQVVPPSAPKIWTLAADAQLLAFCSDDRKCYLADANGKRELSLGRAKDQAELQGLDIRKEGIVGVYSDGSVQRWARDGTASPVVALERPSSNDAAINGKRAVLIWSSMLWSRTMLEVLDLEHPAVLDKLASEPSVLDLAFSFDGRSLVASSETRVPYVFSAIGEARGRFADGVEARQVAFRSDGSVVSLGTNASVAWDPLIGRTVAKLGGGSAVATHASGLTAIAGPDAVRVLGADGAVIATIPAPGATELALTKDRVFESRKGVISEWTLAANPQLVKAFGSLPSAFSAFAVAEDAGVLVAVQPRGHIRTWTLAGEPKADVTWDEMTFPSAIAVTRDASRMAIIDNSDKDGFFIGDKTVKMVTRVPYPSGALSVAISPDGKVIATGGRDGVIRLHAALDGKPIGTMTAHDVAPISIVPTFELFGPKHETIPRRQMSWLVVAADGRVDGSLDAAAAQLRWQTGDQFLPGLVGWQEHASSGLFPSLIGH